MKSRNNAPQVSVLQSVSPPGTTTQFIDQIVRHAPGDVSFQFFSWRRALLGRYQVFHVHWPELLIRGRSPLRAFAKRMLLRSLVARLRWSRTPVVRTVHNIEPHEQQSAAQAAVLAKFDSLCTHRIVMSDCTPTTGGGEVTLIPHGDYREPFSGHPRMGRAPGRVLLFGVIRPYKGVLELIRAADQLEAGTIEVRIVGNPTPDMRTAIEQRARDAQGVKVTALLRPVSDSELAAEISAAELVALPYRDAGNGNSGAAMLALSLDRPVLAVRACLMERLAEEAGSEWVQLIDGDLTGDAIVQALGKVRRLPQDASPRLVSRDWATIASAYAAVYRRAAGSLDRGASDDASTRVSVHTPPHLDRTPERE